MIRISEILARLRSSGLAGPVPPSDIAVTGISDDSRRIKAGELFCAVRGHVQDGHRFLRDAAKAGAVAALVEEPDDTLGLPQFKVADSRRAAAVAAHVVYGDPSAGLKLVGVTGTNGKTTTVHLIWHILSRRGPSGSLGTLGVRAAGGGLAPTPLTTLGPVEFARRLAEFEASGVEHVICEVSSHALAQGRVDGARFGVAVFTNLTRDHLDYHADLDDYRNAKLRLADLVTPDGTIVVNSDEPAWADLLPDQRSVRYGLSGSPEYTARDVELGPQGSSWTLDTPSGSAHVQLPLLGGFNVVNALAAAAASGVCGFEAEALAEALARVSPVVGRLEVLNESPRVIRDYAHTPDALKAALETLRPIVAGRLIVVFGCGGDRDPGKRPLMGRAAAEGSDFAIVTSDNPRSEPPQKIVDDILPGLTGAAYEQIVDRRAAIARALQLARPEDTVLLAGKGHEVEQVVAGRRIPFDEAKIVRELLAQSPGSA